MPYYQVSVTTFTRNGSGTVYVEAADEKHAEEKALEVISSRLPIGCWAEASLDEEVCPQEAKAHGLDHVHNWEYYADLVG